MARNDEKRPLLVSSRSNSTNDLSRSAVSLADAGTVKEKPKRLVSLDAVRGLTVAVMVFVDDTGEWFARGVNHSPWNDITFADFVMPFFLFMVGTSMAMSFRKYRSGLLKKVIVRTAKLFIIGLMTQGSDFPAPGSDGFDLKRIRVGGILQRIAWAYFVVSLMAMYLPKFTTTFEMRGQFADVPQNTTLGRMFSVFRFYILHWVVAFSSLIVYLLIMLSMHVPTYVYTSGNSTYVQHCDVSGDLSEACNAAREVDLKIMGWDHMYPHPMYKRSEACSSCSPSFCPITSGAPAWCQVPMDPEGIMSSVPTVLTTYIGMHFGNILIHKKENGERLGQWTAFTLFLLSLGLIIHFAAWPMNKQLWSPSYLFFMAGCTGLTLTIFYVLLDFIEWQPQWFSQYRKIFTSPRSGRAFAFRATDLLRPFVWVGMNTFFIYLMAAADLFESAVQYLWWDKMENNLIDLSFTGIFCHNPTTPIEQPAQMFSRCQGGVFGHGYEKDARIFYYICKIAFWFAIAGILHRRKWYWIL